MNGDQNQLISFFEDFDNSLHIILLDHKELFDKEMHSLYLEAFDDIKNRIENITDFIENQWEQIEDKLENRGLTGDHLKYKIRGYFNAKENWGGRRIIHLILRVLKWANIILGSISNIVPGGEVVKEFKEAVEESIDEFER